MVNKCLLDGKLKERENTIILNKIEDARQFVKYFVKLMEDILNSEFKFDVDKKTQKIFDKYFFENIPKIKKENI